jgi:hypothetical protein
MTFSAVFVLLPTHQVFMLDSLQNCPHMFCSIFLQDKRHGMGKKQALACTVRCNAATANSSQLELRAALTYRKLFADTIVGHYFRCSC